MGNSALDRFFRRAKAQARKDAELWSIQFPPLHAKLAKALAHRRFLTKAKADEAAIHLGDWIIDLHELNRLFASKRWNPAHAQKVLMGFVAHVPNHLAAAHRIMYDDPLTDVFEIGATKGNGKGSREPGAPYPEAKHARKPSKRMKPRPQRR